VHSRLRISTLNQHGARCQTCSRRAKPDRPSTAMGSSDGTIIFLIIYLCAFCTKWFGPRAPPPRNIASRETSATTFKLYSASSPLSGRARISISSNPRMIACLDKLGESSVEWRTDFDAFVEVDCGNSTLGNTLRREFEFLGRSSQHTKRIFPQSVGAHLVNVFVSSRGAKSVQAKLFVRILLPA
jgi:hypothetical protein